MFDELRSTIVFPMPTRYSSYQQVRPKTQDVSRSVSQMCSQRSCRPVSEIITRQRLATPRIVNSASVQVPIVDYERKRIMTVQSRLRADKEAQMEVNRQIKRVMTASAATRSSRQTQIALNYQNAQELLQTEKLANPGDRPLSLMRSQSAYTRRRKLSFDQYEVSVNTRKSHQNSEIMFGKYQQNALQESTAQLENT